MRRTLCLLCLASVILAAPSFGEKLTAVADGAFSSKAYSLTLPLSGQKVVRLNAAGALSGTLTIRSGGNEGRIEYQKRLKARDLSDAEDFADVISVNSDRTEEGFTVNMEAPVSAPWSGTNYSGQIEMTVTLPENATVRIIAAYFDIDVKGPLAGLTIEECSGKVRASTIRGTVDIKAANRPLMVEDITGGLYLSNRNSEIRMHNIDTGEDGATVDNDAGEIAIDGLRGSVDLRTTGRSIIARKLLITGRKNQIKNNAGEISLEFDSLTTGGLRVNNQYGRIELTVLGRTNAAFICKIGEKGTVTAERMTMTPTLVEDNRLEFTAGGGTAEVRLTVRGDGDIRILGSESDAEMGQTP